VLRACSRFWLEVEEVGSGIQLGWVVVALEITDAIELGRGKLPAFGNIPVRNASHRTHIALTARPSGLR
jgi:hypothetical protein